MKKETDVTCYAKNCVYHNGRDACSAGSIEVGDETARRRGETSCATFKLDENAARDFRASRGND